MEANHSHLQLIAIDTPTRPRTEPDVGMVTLLQLSWKVYAEQNRAHI